MTSSADQIVVAHDERIEGFDRTGEMRLWSVKGVANPSSIVLSRDAVAVLDGFGDRVAIVANGTVEMYNMPGTPVAAAFFGRDIWIVLRDHSSVLRITPDGGKIEIGVALDPAFIGVSEQFVYVYSRAEGVLQEIDPGRAQVVRTVSVGTGGWDLDVHLPKPGADDPSATAFIRRPASGTVAAVHLLSMKSREMKLGRAAVDLAFERQDVLTWDAKSGRPRRAPE